MRAKPTQRHQKCGNCYDGKPLMPGETCGICGNKEPLRKSKPDFQHVPKDYREWIELGDLRLAKLQGGTLWMQHRRGEGMEVDRKKLAAVLEKFFWKEF